MKKYHYEVHLYEGNHCFDYLEDFVTATSESEAKSKVRSLVENYDPSVGYKIFVEEA